MNGKQLFDWLLEIEKDNPGSLEKCEVLLDVPSDCYDLITEKVYDENRDGKLDTIYLVHK